MCGILGWISKSKNVNKELLLKLNNLQKHRGPDNNGIWISKNKNIGFAHRRLSIIDLTHNANQPMNLDEQFYLIFNGEIYNYKELREELQKNYFCKFKTAHSDSEVILHAYKTWGIDKTISKLRGMFAFSIYDKNKNKIYIVRDRIGIKPLYYFYNENEFLFSSEMKVLLGKDNIKRELDLESFYFYLTYRTVPASLTIFNNIFKLEASHYLEINPDTLQVKKYKYWNPLDFVRSNKLDLESNLKNIDDLINESIKLRLQTDVPFGLFLSGGIDSTLILAYMSKYKNNVDTFTIKYENPQNISEDETYYAKFAAKKFQSKYHELMVTERMYLEAFEDSIYYMEEPSAAPVVVSQYLLSKMANQNGTKVVLSGEGGDEVFLGYNYWTQIYKMSSFLKMIKYFPDRIKHIIYNNLNKYWANTDRKKEFLRRGQNNQPLFWGGVEDFYDNQKNRLLVKSFDNNFTYKKTIEQYWNIFSSNNLNNDLYIWMTYLDLNIRLPELMLNRLDKMGMAHSIEGRVPLLDHKLIEFSLSIPTKYKLKGNDNKYLLKKLAEQYYPKDFVYRKKTGFTAPVNKWFKNAFGEEIKRKIISFNLEYGLFNKEALDQIFDGTFSNRNMYYSLAMFVLWHDKFIKG